VTEAIIKSIRLNNFRCHESYRLDFPEMTTQILGENGWGKTSILEAIYIALQGKSFRAVDREIFRRGAEFYRVDLEMMDGIKMSVSYDSETTRKMFLVEDRKFARLPKKNRYPVVLFVPEDLHLVSSSPSRKREFFDRILGQLDDRYSVLISRYNKTLKQRNELLKRDFLDNDSLFSWNVMLAKYGKEISEKRKWLIVNINKRLTEVYRGIAKNLDEVKVEYQPYIGDIDESGYLKLLTMDFDRDKITGHTNFGIHKDDYQFIFNGVIADGSASRGEVRSMVVALKFIEAEMLYEKLGKRPVVLLDDVFSELDKVRSAALVENFKDNQIILTSVG